jgi:hypothetical protein
MSLFRQHWRRKWRNPGKLLSSTTIATGRVAQTLILDQFTDANGTSLDAHTIAPINTPAATWTEGRGDFDIQSNQANVAASGAVTPRNTAYVDVGQSNVIVEATVVPVLGSFAGIVGRVNSAANMWAIVVKDADNAFEIVEWASDNDTVRATTSVTITPGVSYTIRVTFNGTSISATLNGANAISYASSLYQAETRFGIIERQNTTGIRWDNFTVTTL